MTEFFSKPDPLTQEELGELQYAAYRKRVAEEDHNKAEELRLAVYSLANQLVVRNVEPNLSLMDTPVRRPAGFITRLKTGLPIEYDAQREIGKGWLISTAYHFGAGNNGRQDTGGNSSRIVALNHEGKLVVGRGDISQGTINVFGEIRWIVPFHTYPPDPACLQIYTYPEVAGEVSRVGKLYEEANLDELTRDVRSKGRQLLGLE